MSERISIKCPRCLQGMQIPEVYLSSMIRCRQCQQQFQPGQVIRTRPSSEAVDAFQESDIESLMETHAEADAPSVEVPHVVDSVRVARAAEADANDVIPLTPGSQNDGNSEVPVSSRDSSGMFGRFVVKRELGQGGFGMVYEAFDPRLQRTVALKVPTLDRNSRQRLRRFETEARSAARLHHPNIVTVYDNGKTADGRLFIASEYVAGSTLKALIKDEETPLRELMEWIRDLAEALAYAHSEGIVHRDIKPENILIDLQHRRPKVADFGLAKVLHHSEDVEAPLKTQDGVLGTPAFMAPEQARGELSRVGAHSDQYSLGAVMYQCLTGKTPFSGSTFVVIAAVGGDDQPVPIGQLAPGVPKDLIAVCEKAMSKDAAARYETADQFAEDLNRWLRDEPVMARRTTAAVRFVRWCRRNPTIAALTTALAIVLISATVSLSVLLERAQREKLNAVAAGIAAQQSADKARDALKDAKESEEKAIAAQQEAETAKKEAVDNAEEAQEKKRQAIAAKEELQKTFNELKREKERGVALNSNLDMEKAAKEEVRLAKVLQEANTDYAKAVGLMSSEPDHALLWFARALVKVESESERTDAMNSFAATVRQALATELPRMPTLISSKIIATEPLRAGAVVLSANADRVAAVTGSGRQDAALLVADVETGKQIFRTSLATREPDQGGYTPEAGDARCNSLCFGPNTSSVIIARGRLEINLDPNRAANTPMYRSVDSNIEFHDYSNPDRPLVNRLYQTTPGPIIFPTVSLHDDGLDFSGFRAVDFGRKQNQLFAWTPSDGLSLGPVVPVPDEIVAFRRRRNGDYLLATGRTVREISRRGALELREFASKVKDIVLNAEHTQMAVVLEDGEVHVYDTRKEADARILQHGQTAANHVIFDRHSDAVVSASEHGGIRIWNVAAQRARDLPLYSKAVPLQVAINDDVVTAVSNDGSLRQWRLPQANDGLQLAIDSPTSAAFTPDGSHVVMVSFQKPSARLRSLPRSKLFLFDVHSGKQEAGIDVPGKVSTMKFTNDGRMLVVNSHQQVQYLDTRGFSQQLPPFTLPVTLPTDVRIAELDVSENNRDLILLLSDGTVYANTEKRGFRRLAANLPTSVACSQDGQYMAIGTQEGRVILVQPQSAAEHQEIRYFNDSIISDLCFSPDGSQLAVGTDSATVGILKVDDLTQEQAFQHPSGERIVNIAFLADGVSLSTATDRGFYEWNLNTGLKTASYGTKTSVTAISPSGKHVLEGDRITAVTRAIEDSAAEVQREIETKLGLSLTADGLLQPHQPD
ncbi:MAG: protein kinase [Planctomycetaceae bacterium]